MGCHTDVTDNPSAYKHIYMHMHINRWPTAYMRVSFCLSRGCNTAAVIATQSIIVGVLFYFIFQCFICVEYVVIDFIPTQTKAYISNYSINMRLLLFVKFQTKHWWFSVRAVCFSRRGRKAGSRRRSE